MATIVSQISSDPPGKTGPSHRSFSQLKNFLRCPKAYWFDYRSGEKVDTVSENLVIGSAVHAGCEYFNLARLEQADLPDVADMIDMAEVTIEAEALDREIIKSDGSLSDKGALVDTAARLIRCYRDQVEPSREVLAVETEFTIESRQGFPDLIGRIDLIEKTDNGIAVIDIKTASSKSTGDPAYAWQLSLYSHSAGKRFNAEPSAELHSLIKTKSPQFVIEEVPVSREMIHRAYANVTATCLAIAACDASGQWPAAYGSNCRSCHWRDKCLL